MHVYDFEEYRAPARTNRLELRNHATWIEDATSCRAAYARKATKKKLDAATTALGQKKKKKKKKKAGVSTSKKDFQTNGLLLLLYLYCRHSSGYVY